MRKPCFADLSEAAAAFAFDPGLAFRCNVCGLVHRTKGRGWHRCAESFGERWRLRYFVRLGKLDEKARARPSVSLERLWSPSLLEVLAAGRLSRETDLPLPDRADRDLVAEEDLEVPVVWLLSLESAAVAKVLGDVWEKWWGQVKNVIRETKAQLVRMIGCLEPWEKFEPTEVKRDELLAGVLVDHRFEGAHSVDRMLVGRRAIVWKPTRMRYDGRLLENGQVVIRDETVVSFYRLGCRIRVRVSYPAVLADAGVGRPLEWFFDVVEEPLPDPVQAG